MAKLREWPVPKTWMTPPAVRDSTTRAAAAAIWSCWRLDDLVERLAQQARRGLLVDGGMTHRYLFRRPLVTFVPESRLVGGNPTEAGPLGSAHDSRGHGTGSAALGAGRSGGSGGGPLGERRPGAGGGGAAQRRDGGRAAARARLPRRRGGARAAEGSPPSSAASRRRPGRPRSASTPTTTSSPRATRAVDQRALRRDRARRPAVRPRHRRRQGRAGRPPGGPARLRRPARRSG